MNTMANNMAANMPNMGGPVNAQQMQQMMNNNGAIPQHQGGSRLSRASPNHSSRMQLNTYVYEYFLRFEMYDCARALLAAAPDIATKKEENGQDENGNRLGDDPMDTDAKEFDLKRPDDLPAPLTPAAAPNQSFLFEWFCLFWDLFTHKEHKVSPQIQQYLAHTQVCLWSWRCSRHLVANDPPRLRRVSARNSNNTTCSATSSEERPNLTSLSSSSSSSTRNSWAAWRMVV